MIVNIILRIIINAVAIVVTASLLPGIALADNEIGTLLIVGLVIGIVNAFVKPIVKLLTLPLTLITLGLFLLVINALMLLLADALLPQLTVDGFLTALLGGLIMAIVGVVVERLLEAVFGRDI
jgi:putative membrane protein